MLTAAVSTMLSVAPPAASRVRVEEEPHWWGEARYSCTATGSFVNEQQITCVEYDETGDLIALGDRRGHVTILKDKKAMASFKSHDPDFDYLKSQEIEEKINKVKFCRPVNNAHFLLSTNDKTIKLWKIAERDLESVSQDRSHRELKFPKVTKVGRVMSAWQRRVYANAHAFHIHSISVNSDGETFASSDDLRVNLWKLDVSTRAFNVLDLKPAAMDDLAEIITCMSFHPVDCNALMYASSKGTLKLFDLRRAARCVAPAVLLADDSGERNFYLEAGASVRDARFAGDRYVVSRDFLRLKVWDLRKPQRPVTAVAINDHLKSRLADLYESELIFDKFECCATSNSDAIVTGTYSNTCSVFDSKGRLDITLPATYKRHDAPGGHIPLANTAAFEVIDFEKRLLHLAAHPRRPALALAAHDTCYFFDLHNHLAQTTQNGGASTTTPDS